MTTTSLNRHQRIWISFRSVPAWVQIWVALILIPVNAAGFFLMDWWSGQMVAWAALFVVATNMPIMYLEGGMSRLMSIPHLIAWIPLELGLIMRLMGEVGAAAPSQPEMLFIVLVLAVNGISLVFDGLDSVRWLRGERDIPGFND